MRFLLLLLPLLAHADDFNDRAHQSFQQQKAQEDAARQHRFDEENLKLVQLMYRTEQLTGGVNQTGKCYGTHDISRARTPVPWSYKGYSMPIYSERSLIGQKWAIGTEDNVMMLCNFNTNTGYACQAEGYDSSVMCYDKRNVEYKWNGKKMVRFVPEPAPEPTPISECARRELDWMQSQQQCNQMNDSHDRDLCLSALGNDPGGCNQ